MSLTEEQTTRQETEAGEKRWLAAARARCAEVTKELYGEKAVSCDPQYRSWSPESTAAPTEITRAEDDMKFDTEHKRWVNATPQEF
jgi:fibrillarin-like rRNA methylase